MLIGGETLPWVVEYDFELPVDATYTLSVRYASAGVRPVEILLDNKSVDTCFLKMTCNAPPYLDRHPNAWEGLRGCVIILTIRAHSCSFVSIRVQLVLIRVERNSSNTN